MELSINTAKDDFLKELENPRSVHEEIKYQKDNFSKLKFQYLEQETRDKFLRNLLNNDINGLINNEELVKRQQENADIKKSLKQMKRDMNAKQADINSVTDRLLQQHHQYETQLHKNESLLNDIKDIETKIDDIDKQLDFQVDLPVDETQTSPDDIAEVSDYVNYYHQRVKHTEQIDAQISNDLFDKNVTVTNKRQLVDQLAARLRELQSKITNSADSDSQGEYNNLGKWMLGINNLLTNFISSTIECQLEGQEFTITINGQFKLVFDITNFLLVSNNFNLDQVSFNLSNDKFVSLSDIIVNIGDMKH